jgi:hypothetical protein
MGGKVNRFLFVVYGLWLVVLLISESTISSRQADNPVPNYKQQTTNHKLFYLAA